MAELPIIQKTYDLIKWYIPIKSIACRFIGLKANFLNLAIGQSLLAFNLTHSSRQGVKPLANSSSPLKRTKCLVNMNFSPL